MKAAVNLVVAASSSPSSERKRMRRIIRKRRRRNKTRVIAPSTLPNELIEEIFLRLPVKVQIRLRSLSKHWKVTLESLSFAERHLKIAKQSRMKLIMVIDSRLGSNPPRPDADVGFRIFCLESASLLSFTLINFSQGFGNRIYISGNCDGLFCIHSPQSQSIYVVNPATRWLRQLPSARFQILIHKFNPTLEDWIAMDSVFHLAFVKAAANYKLVWLYNSDKYNADLSCPNQEVTKCEVFDFRANAWRYLACTPSYRIFPNQKPAYANGSVYWLTELHEARIEVVDFDIHTETFRLLPKIIPAIHDLDPRHIDMCTLDNHLCMSKREHVTKIQDIWRLNPSKDTWEKILSIDLLSSPSPRTEIRDQFEWSDKDLVEPSTPVAVCKNKKILLSHRCSRGLVKYDPLTKSLDFFYRDPMAWRKVTYFPSLISHI